MIEARKIVLLGMMTKMPVAGVVWQTMHYLVGLQRLGFDPYYVEAHARTPSMLMSREDDDSSAKAAAFIGDVMGRFGFGDRWAFHALHDDQRCLGLSRGAVRRLYRDASLIVNLHGGTEPLPEHAETGRLVYLETDPVQLQAELAAGLQATIDFLERHCAFFTFAENYGRDGCGLPVTERFRFEPTRQPVVLDLWEPAGGRARNAFTTVGNWRQHWRTVELDGEAYHWSKHHEFLRFLDVPHRTGRRFELALSSYDDDDRALLERHGFRVRHALGFSTDLEEYRSYIGSSRGEFTVAKDQNIRLRTGWFSDRSATYLAAGRPVITQDTGFGDVLPTGEGLFAFSTVEEVEAAVSDIDANYRTHRRAAREIAHEYFDARRVLRSLLERAGVTSPVRKARAPRPRVRAPERPATSRTSVVIPCYDLGEFLVEAVASVRMQTLPAHELIVVDDGSTDEATVAVLDRLAAEGVTVVRKDHRGAPAARNHGIERATGDYVVCLDADDVLEPAFLEETVAELNGDPRVGVVGTHVQFFGNRDGVWEPPEFVPSTLLWENCIPSASLFRKSCWQQAGGYADLEACQDWSFWLSIVERGWRWAIVPNVLYRYRVRTGSVSEQGRELRPQLLRRLVELHAETYRKNWPQVFSEMDAEVARLRSLARDLELEQKARDSQILALKEALDAASRTAAEARQPVAPWVVHLRRVVEKETGDGADVLVTGGDPELLSFRGRNGIDFSISGSDAVSALEDARSRGAELLVVPAEAAAEFERRTAFRRYLEARYYGLVREKTLGVVYDLRSRLDLPTFSVVVCTRGRPERLRTAVKSVLRQDYPADRYEVLVVDNEPAPRVREVVGALQAVSPRALAYHEEPRAGLSHARNAGVARARCEYVAFLDDDAEADESWLTALAGGVNQHGALVVGGRVEPVFEGGDRPKWLDDQYVKGFFGLDYRDWGKSDRFIRVRAPLYLGGGNSAYAKRLFRHFGGFRPELGRNGVGLLAGEESLLNLRLDLNDVPIYYAADAVVRHAIPPARAAKRDVRRRAYWSGVSDAVLTELLFEPDEFEEAVHGSQRCLRAALRGGRSLGDFARRCRIAHELGFLRRAHSLRVRRRLRPRPELPPVTWTAEHMLAEAERLPHGPERERRRSAALRALGRTTEADEALARTVRYDVDLAPNTPTTTHLLRPQYERLVERLRGLLDSALPAGARILVASKGDENLVRFRRHEGWHFPQGDGGVYAGYYPSDSGQAIAQIERLRAAGADYLVFPTTSLWWLDHYRGLSRYLESSFRVVRRGEPCTVFALREEPEEARVIA